MFDHLVICNPVKSEGWGGGRKWDHQQTGDVTWLPLPLPLGYGMNIQGPGQGFSGFLLLILHPVFLHFWGEVREMGWPRGRLKGKA